MQQLLDHLDFYSQNGNENDNQSIKHLESSGLGDYGVITWLDFQFVFIPIYIGISIWRDAKLNTFKP